MKHTRLRNAEFIQLMRNIDVIVVEGGLLPLMPLQTNFENEINNLDVIFKANKKNPFTDDIHKLDSNRDGTLTGIINIIKGNIHHWNPSISEGALALKKIISNHGSNIINLNLHEETAVLSSLINEIETTPALTEAVNALHLTSWLEKLKESNTRCSELLVNRLENKADASKVNGTELRKIIFSIYTELIRTIDAHIILASEGDYQRLKDRINEVNKEFNATLNLRK